jgi:hypothetical protein
VVTVLETSERHTSNFHAIDEDDLLTIDGIRLGFLAPGTLFNLRSWRVSHLPQRQLQEAHRPDETKEQSA